ncbi:5-methylcytosine-specific restriction enzyme A [Burkholderia multivorans]
MIKPLENSHDIAVKPENVDFSFQNFQQRRLAWIDCIKNATLSYDINIRDLDQKSPSFEFSCWRVNIEHVANYESAIIMWTAGEAIPAPKRNSNWIDVSPSDKKQRWNYRRKLTPRDLYGLLFELRESSVMENSYQSILEQNVRKAMTMPSSERTLKLHSISKTPRFYEVKTRVFGRNPYVIAEVLLRANGSCEACGNSAPFRRRTDDTPYLEVHHRKPLSDGGDDSVENAIGLCPNCHRKAHFG